MLHLLSPKRWGPPHDDQLVDTLVAVGGEWIGEIPNGIGWCCLPFLRPHGSHFCRHINLDLVSTSLSGN